MYSKSGDCALMITAQRQLPTHQLKGNAHQINRHATVLVSVLWCKRSSSSLGVVVFLLLTAAKDAIN